MKLVVYLPLFLSSLLAITAGCSRTEIDVSYGKRRGNPGAESVNGTAVLSGMFEKAGFRVTTWRRLSPKLQECQTIVWVPDNFTPPTLEQRAFLERWVHGKPGRTLVYVGRDYDAAVEYWRQIQSSAPAQQAMEVMRRQALSQAIHDRQRAKMPEGESSDWFVVHRDGPRHTASQLQGAWASDLHVTQTDIEMEGSFEIPAEADINKWVARANLVDAGRPKYERLLYSGDQTIATRISWNQINHGQIVVVSNGSFLLNLPLVNHEHRKLAGKLISACGTPGRAVFLESGQGGPAVFDKEPGADAPTGFEVFTVWPMGIILVHLTALGFLACIAMFPVFGRPRELVTSSSTDFGQHVDALGELLEQVGDREYALQRVRAYQEHCPH